jgi:hypothetical protein
MTHPGTSPPTSAGLEHGRFTRGVGQDDLVARQPVPLRLPPAQPVRSPCETQDPVEARLWRGKRTADLEYDLTAGRRADGRATYRSAPHGCSWHPVGGATKKGTGGRCGAVAWPTVVRISGMRSSRTVPRMMTEWLADRCACEGWSVEFEDNLADAAAGAHPFLGYADVVEWEHPVEDDPKSAVG